ncbi:MAG: T9SS type B sorting domain-containing protein, partial [Cyclobacteriaceae bacterium]|nr:T9SS type B sorting domain-containing protein [Cyclobacteriaceae bacterium]
DSNVYEVNITILPVNDAPVISNLEPFQLNFSQGDAPVKITNTLTVNDIDNSSMLYAEIKILDFTESTEGLIYDDKGIGVITSLYDPKTGILVLEGEESKSAYEEALKNISYKNDIIGFSDQVNRVIELKVNDGLSFSEPVYRKINIINILPDISVVNAFTPNDDGINDYWDFENLDYYKFINIKVYSVDKQLLFQCDNRECKWDGKLNGKTLESGPYFYLIDLEKGKRIYKGTVYLLN